MHIPKGTAMRVMAACPVIRRVLLTSLLLVPSWIHAQETGDRKGAPVVRSVLFYSPTCPHCEDLIRNTLPPLMQRYGDRLDMVGISIATRSGADMYRAVIAHFLIPESRQGVPTLLIGSTVLVGGNEIPARLPELVDRALAGDGIDWPDVPAVRATLRAQGLIEAPQDSDSARSPEPVPAPDTAKLPGAVPPDSAAPDSSVPPGRIAAPDASAARARVTDDVTAADSAAAVDRTAADPGDSPATAFTRDPGSDLGGMTMVDRFRLDPVGNSAAVAVLVLLGAVLLFVAFGLFSPGRGPPPPSPWLIPALALAGMAVAAYLAWVEVTGAEAVCGPVGDCNTVQQSEYARVLGVPMGLLGLAGYAAMLGFWAISLRGSGRTRRTGRLLVWSTALVATLWSWYLTFLEPFVIGATCAWCLSSSVIAALLLLCATPDAVREIRPVPKAEA